MSNKNLKGYATENWVLKKLQGNKSVGGTTSTGGGGGVSIDMTKYFDQVDDPDNPGEKIWIAKDSHKTDGVHIVKQGTTHADGKKLIYEEVTDEDLGATLRMLLAKKAELAKSVNKVKFAYADGSTPTSEKVIKIKDSDGVTKIEKACDSEKVGGMKIVKIKKEDYNPSIYDTDTLYLLY